MVRGRKMLLADDSITIQKVVDLTFADEGMQVTTVSNGEQAIERLEEVAPDIVLADVFMPGRSGYEVCEHIKRNERFRHIPVMLLVGSFEPFDEAEARRVGADDFLTKPFQSIRQLVNKVGALLSGSDDEATTKDLELPEEVAQAESRRNAKPSELSMADTAPLPQIRDAAEAAPVAPTGHAQFDDEMIEAAPASHFGSADGARQAQQAAPHHAEEFEEMSVPTEGARVNQRDEISSIQMQETIQNFSFEEREEAASPRSEPAPSAQSVPYIAQATAADEALLDLGDIEPPSSAREADDFILDLMDEAPAQPAPQVEEMSEETLIDFQEEMVESAPQVEEYADPHAATEAEPTAHAATEVDAAYAVTERLAPAEEAANRLQATTDSALTLQETQGVTAAAAASAQWPQAESPMAETIASPVDGGEQFAAGRQPAHAAAAQITLEQLSPEVIDAIARRAVEQLSEKVVQEIAWEVVPQLAELLIKRKLEEKQ